MIEADKKPEEIRQEPVELHKDFRWVTVNLSDPNEVGYHSKQGVEMGQTDPVLDSSRKFTNC